METIDDFYKEWRWLTYNELDSFKIYSILVGNNFAYPDEKYNQNIIENYKKRCFAVSLEQIQNYENNLRKRLNHSNNTSSYLEIDLANFYFLRSVFIENCLINVNQISPRDLIDKIKTNIKYYHWWDELNFKDLALKVINNYFLKSTRELIGEQPLLKFFYYRFKTKEDLINQLLINFSPSDYAIEQMNAFNSRGNVIFDYRWLFGNELTNSIRIFENECRFEFDEKIIGSFFNENLLFREVKKKFSNQFTIISQGSPEWLKPQRFDIFIPEINLAIEYQGEQHFYPVDFGGKGKKYAQKQFQENLKRDIIKKEKALKNNCTIFFVNPKYNLNDIFLNIEKLIDDKLTNDNYTNL